ncbi:hypothetical protein HYZ82_03100 [Candidatus Nomurabacteria bacterium]|nr:hypothetical protein [Candidatus Nomurabacteria bacterium]
MKKVIFKYLNIEISRAEGSAGFVLLFAVTLASILLALALGVANIALKEIKFSTSARNTNDAFFAADTGVESALFQDKDGDICAPAPCSYSFTVLSLGSTGQGCAKVTVDKAVAPATTSVVSKGYNIGNALCDSANPDRIERQLRVTYGDD